MQTLTVSKKTGFKNMNLNKSIVLRDFRGLTFFDTTAMLNNPDFFNLPAGKYLIDSGHFKELPKPVPYRYFKLPPFERHFKTPANFKIVFGDNPNKCSIYWNKGIILFDNELKDYSLPELDLIRFHEFSHARYKTERYADLMAMNYMLCKGYNPVQIGESLLTSLSDNNYDRKVFATNKILSYERERKLFG